MSTTEQIPCDQCGRMIKVNLVTYDNRILKLGPCLEYDAKNQCYHGQYDGDFDSYTMVYNPARITPELKNFICDQCAHQLLDNRVLVISHMEPDRCELPYQSNHMYNRLSVKMLKRCRDEMLAYVRELDRVIQSDA